MNHNQLVTYVEYSVVLGILIGFLLREMVVSFFEKNKDFRIAKMEELPKGEYTVFDVKPKGDFNEILVIKLYEDGKNVGHLMSVYLDYSMSYILQDHKSKIVSFSLFYKKRDCFIEVKSRDNVSVERIITFKKTFSPRVCGNQWEMIPRLFLNR